MTAMSAEPGPTFEAYRPLLFGIAYRMLGSSTDAEDIVQEAYLRFQAQPLDQLVSPKAFLSTVVTRLCLNHLHAARAQRETYLGPWLPEPVLTAVDDRFAPAQRAELAESLSLAFLVLLEQLTPVERAVFLLRAVFDYDYREIAAIVDKSDTTCRQIFRRAKQHLAAGRPRFTPSAAAHRQLLDHFTSAARDGALDALLRLLTADVELWTDGGGKVRGALQAPLQGRAAVARFVLTISRRAAASGHAMVAEVNGEPAVLVADDGAVRVVLTIGVDDGRVSMIRVLGNPDKLQDLNRVLGSLGAIDP